MNTATTNTIRCPGCGASTAPTEKCGRCGWNLSSRLWEAFVRDQKRRRRARR
jgi:DNA-directed RNA polymerase subunit RPC12/RpoP